MSTYCVKCKEDTKNMEQYVEKKGNKSYLKSRCSECDANKSKLMPANLRLTKDLNKLNLNRQKSDDSNYTPNAEEDDESSDEDEGEEEYVVNSDDDTETDDEYYEDDELIDD